MLKKLLAKKKASHVGKGEVKIAVLVVYIFVMEIISIASNVYLGENAFNENLKEYIQCESTGHSENCLNITEITSIHFILYDVITVMLTFVPVVVFLITCNFAECRQSIRKNIKQRT